MLESVERPRDGRRGPELGVDDDDVLRSHDAPAELRENTGERVLRIRAPGCLWSDIARPPQHVVGLVEPELADVARDGRLSHLATGAGERVEQLVLSSTRRRVTMLVINFCRSCFSSGRPSGCIGQE